MWYSELVTTPLGGTAWLGTRPLANYRRDGVRSESDVTDKEWVIVEPMIPKQGRLGRPRQTDPRDVFNAIQYVLATGASGGRHRVISRPIPRP